MLLQRRYQESQRKIYLKTRANGHLKLTKMYKSKEAVRHLVKHPFVKLRIFFLVCSLVSITVFRKIRPIEISFAQDYCYFSLSL